MSSAVASSSAQQPAVSPVTPLSSPSPAPVSEKRAPEEDATTQPVSAASPASPAAPASAEPPTSSAPPAPVAPPANAQTRPARDLHPPRPLNMQPATLYANPVDPKMAAESVIWKRAKFLLIVAAVLVAIASLGVSLGILRPDGNVIITRTGSFLGSTIPLHILVILWGTVELAIRIASKGKTGANPNAGVAMWLFILILAISTITVWSMIAYWEDFEYADFTQPNSGDNGYDDGYGGGGGGGSGGDDGGSGYDSGYGYDDGFGTESDNGSGSSYSGSSNPGPDGFANDGSTSGYNYARTVTNAARSILRRSVTASDGWYIRKIVVAGTVLNGVIALFALVIFIGDCIAARRHNTTREPAVAKTQPEAAGAEESSEEASATETHFNKSWAWSKHGANLSAFVVSIVAAVLSLLFLARFNDSNGYGYENGYYSYYYSDFYDFPPCSAVPLFTLVWVAAEYITQRVRGMRGGIHPGAHVGVWLVIAFAAGLVGAFQTVIAANSFRDCKESDFEGDSRSSYSDSSDCYPVAQRNIAIAAASFMDLLFMISLFLFVAACADTEVRNSQAARATVYVPVSYEPQVGGVPSRYYVQQRQTVQLANGEKVTGYVVPPPQVAYMQQPAVPQYQRQQPQPQQMQQVPRVNQPLVSGQQQPAQPTASGSHAGTSAHGPAPSDSGGRQSQIMEYYGVAS